ncbi:MAG: hypothetical protein ACRDTC_15685 [Pseudonocardiaceae bacterium]
MGSKYKLVPQLAQVFAELGGAHALDAIRGPPADARDFIRSTFDGLHFDAADRAFLDSAWSHLDQLTGAKRTRSPRWC